jgi:putative zinc finger/helix-turn-helix YgiT family protein
MDFCPVCEKETEITLTSKTECYTIKKREVSVESSFYLCGSCGEEFATTEQMDSAMQQAYAEYRKLEHIISPEKIIAIRERYGASQKAFAKILDLGELTINSLEQGSLATKSISNLIFLMEDVRNFRRLFEQNKEKISSLQQRRITECLSGFYALPDENRGLMEVKDFSEAVHQLDKIILLMQNILIESKEALYKTALLKICFYCDFVSFKRTGHSLSGWNYAAIDHGPVPDGYIEILTHAEETSRIHSEMDAKAIGELYSIPHEVKPDAIQKQFSAKELSIIHEVAQKLSVKSAIELRDLGHNELAWQETAQAAIIDYKWASVLKLF